MRTKDDKKIEAIYKASLDLIYSVWISWITMSSIASQSGIATWTLYIYFKNKNILLNSLFTELQKDNSMSKIQNNSSLSAYNQLFKIWEQSMIFRIISPKKVLFLESFPKSKYISSENAEIKLSDYLFLIDLMDQLKKEQKIRDMDSAMVVALWVWFIRQYSLTIDNNSENNNKDIINNSFDFFWQAIKK